MHRLIFIIHYLIIMSSCSSSSSRTSHLKKVTCYGDSITFASDILKDDRWCTLLEKKFNGKVEFINEGKDGRETNDWEGLANALSRNNDSDIFMIALGTNDLKNSTNERVFEIMANIQKMIQFIKNGNPRIKIILLGTYNISVKNLIKYWLDKGFNAKTQERIDMLTAQMEKYAENTKDVFFIDLNGLLPDESLQDGIHPDAKGHKLIADHIFEKLDDENFFLEGPQESKFY